MCALFSLRVYKIGTTLENISLAKKNITHSEGVHSFLCHISGCASLNRLSLGCALWDMGRVMGSNWFLSWEISETSVFHNKSTLKLEEKKVYDSP